MSAESWKLDKDLCRCCHSEGVFKNLAEPHSNENQVEIYCDMMQQCLDITINPVEGPLYGVTYTICQECIQRLRDACSFKRQVTLCEQRFYELYNRNGIKSTPVCDVEVKIEISDSDHDDMMQGIPLIDENDDDRLDANYENGDTDNKDENDAEIKPEEEEEAKKARPKKARPKKGRPKAKVKQRRQVKKVGRPRKTAAPAPVDVKDVKDFLIRPEDMADYTVVREGVEGRKRYVCNKCGARVCSKDAMRTHIVVGHFNQSLFQCPLCDDRFKRKETRLTHLVKKHGMEEVAVGGERVLQAAAKCVCDVCSKEFAGKQLLARHMLSHRLIRCTECSSKFLHHEIAKHRFEVHGVPIPTCGICGYKNSRESRIIHHQRKVHLKEKNVPCPECDMKFFDTVQLRKHLVRHNPVKVFECRFCKKKFPRSNALRQHEMIHTGEKKKICLICGMRFVQKASLNYHMAKHHPEAS